MNNDNFCISSFIADKIEVGIFKYSLSENKLKKVNCALVKLLRYSSKEELVKINLDGIFKTARDKEKILTLLQNKKKVNALKVTLKTKDNQVIPAELTFYKGKTYIEGTVKKISLRKKDRDLFLEKNFLQNLLDSIPDAIYFKDRRNRLIKVNKFYSQGVGLSPEKIVGKTDFDFFPYEQAKRMFEDDNYVLKTGKPLIGKIERTLLPDGSWNQVITTKIPLYNSKGKIIGTMGITRDMTPYAHSEKERLNMLTNTLRVLGKTLQMRDPYTFDHACKVGYIAECIAKELGWDDNRILGIKLAGELHDIGKIGIPVDILNKPGKLSDLEYKIIQGHVEKCCQLLKDIAFPFPLVEAIYQHHERLDGSGYPRGLKKEEIILEARILAISDVLEAMSSHRPYRESLGVKKAIEEIINGAGIKYDREIVEIVLKLMYRSNNRIFWLNV